jgi:hypothetical protein
MKNKDHMNDSLITRLIQAMRESDDLRKPKYQGNRNIMAGHCYVASEVLYHHFKGRGHAVKAMHVRHEGESHWFLLLNGMVLDVTAGQFKESMRCGVYIPYWKGRGKGLLTALPSKRAVEMARRANINLHTGEG